MHVTIVYLCLCILFIIVINHKLWDLLFMSHNYILDRLLTFSDNLAMIWSMKFNFIYFQTLDSHSYVSFITSLIWKIWAMVQSVLSLCSLSLSLCWSLGGKKRKCKWPLCYLFHAIVIIFCRLVNTWDYLYAPSGRGCRKGLISSKKGMLAN